MPGMLAAAGLILTPTLVGVLAWSRQSLLVNSTGVTWTGLRNSRTIAWSEIRKVTTDPGYASLFGGRPRGVVLTLGNRSVVRVRFSEFDPSATVNLIRCHQPPGLAVVYTELRRERRRPSERSSVGGRSPRL